MDCYFENNFARGSTAISNLLLPISAMDVRKVQSIVKEIYSGEKIKVSFTEDIEDLKNSDKIVVIGSVKTIQYTYQTASEMMSNYFKIVEESNTQLLQLINKFKITNQQYFAIYEFSLICPNLNEEGRLKGQQKNKLESVVKDLPKQCKNIHATPQAIYYDESISTTHKVNAIAWGIWNGNITLEEAEKYLKNYLEKKGTDYRKLLCFYDYKKHLTRSC